MTDTLFNVAGKVAVITGGSGILCGAMAQALAARGEGAFECNEG